jgi:hypothetical protein
MPLRGFWRGQHFGWTTDAAKAETMRGNGATVADVPSYDQRPEARKFDGFEVSFPLGAEAVHPHSERTA